MLACCLLFSYGLTKHKADSLLFISLVFAGNVWHMYMMNALGPFSVPCEGYGLGTRPRDMVMYPGSVESVAFSELHGLRTRRVQGTRACDRVS
ncbi:hypothetical protein F383_28739 [Gossypium arboreum]|uniref:Uncharacterized protein n=1 Tax=Gossypium arboreum TaxID=29729 RepID=A0A0B0MYH5_GOSAR|nr:hypothetical protein F383_28739 [Gossypium arboreum]